MSLIAMAVYCTEENNKDEYLFRTLQSIAFTNNMSNHRLVLSVNGYTKRTEEIITNFSNKGSGTAGINLIDKVIWNDSNLGTAEAINLVWKERVPNEHCIKMDDDVVVHKNGWIDEMEEALRRDSSIGQVGLKRKDCIESPDRNDNYKSELYMLPHKAGERWIIAEKVNHVMGTCVMHSSALLDKVGYLYQPKVYGFDDVLMSIRTRLVGLKSVFLPHIEIDHIDTGGTAYQKEKEAIAGDSWAEYHRVVKMYHSDPKTIYYNPYE